MDCFTSVTGLQSTQDETCDCLMPVMGKKNNSFSDFAPGGTSNTSLCLL